MTLSRKIVVVVSTTFLLLAVIVAASSDMILLKSFRQIEQRNVLSHAQQVRNLLKDREEQVDVAARDVVVGLTDLLVADKSMLLAEQRYFSADNLIIHRIDLAALYDMDGRPLLVRAVDCKKGVYCAIEPDKQQDLNTMVRNLNRSIDRHYKGTVNIGEEPLMVTVLPIKGADGIRRGVLVIGWFIDEIELNHIVRVTGKSAAVSSLDSDQLPPELVAANTELALGEEFVARAVNHENISGYFYQKDITGKPSFIISVTDKRVIFEQGKMIILFIIGVMTVCSAVFCCVILLFIRNAVLRRLSNLSSTVGDISRHGDISERVEVKGSDELEDLAGSINSMLASLESAERALRESEERYRSLFERAPDSIFILDTDVDRTGLIVDANQAACEQHGYSHEELCSLHISDLNSPESNHIAPDIIDRIMNGEWVTREIWHCRKDGSQFPIEIHAGLVMLGGRTFILGFDRDITARKLAEESDRRYLEQIRTLNAELGLAAAELTAANKELQSFNYSVSHDLRGPLTRISGYCQLMLEDDPGIDPLTRTYLSRIYESCCWLDEMIDAMLMLSRLARTDFFPAQVNLSSIVAGVLRDLTLAEPKRAVNLNIAPDVSAIGDARMLKILIGNLLNNSWKYCGRTEVTCIEFGVLESEVYFIRDNGVGFDMKDADKLFRVFKRLHDASQFSGNGIGLATVQRVIERHGGRVWAESEVGLGATFFFTLAPEVPAE